ncbi:hypothetical protein [Nocardioides massiliensis]|uniref:Uncharacterized protein n=1 Tax=Nocardioides massiliensis TaxID=1325935 RepID=A0ABT9NQT0_9ACTN|nr:hypothetical protein [Nocardioides massiliensis]MDP9822784.1 hypothetical protein [Nocardioides massiliensis]
MSITGITARAKRSLRKAPLRTPRGSAVAEIEAAQRYRTMIGAEQPLEERTARARKNAARVAPLTTKTW